MSAAACSQAASIGDGIATLGVCGAVAVVGWAFFKFLGSL